MSEMTGPRALLAELNRLEQLRDPNKIRGQRQYQRFVVRGDAKLTPMDPHGGDESLPVQLRDVGRGGVGFVCQEPLEPLSTWRLSFLQRGYVIGQQGLIVRYCQPVAGGVFLVGAQFCIETGLLSLLGVDPATIHEGDRPTAVADSATYLAPGEVA